MDSFVHCNILYSVCLCMYILTFGDYLFSKDSYNSIQLTCYHDCNTNDLQKINKVPVHTVYNPSIL